MKAERLLKLVTGKEYLLRTCIAVYVSLFVYSGHPAMAQSLTGMTGLLNAPSAEFQRDGTFFIGCSYLDRSTIEYGEGTYHSIAWYGNITILPFVEIGFRSTGRLNENVPFHVDRMPSIRLRILEERRIIPSVVAGAHDFLTSAAIGNQHFGATYLTASKHLNLSGFVAGVHAGYGFSLLRHNQFAGPFGGISLTHQKLDFLTLAAEYDSRDFNLGAKLVIFKHLQLLALWQGLRVFTGGVALKLFLPVE